jgi:fucose permease
VIPATAPERPPVLDARTLGALSAIARAGMFVFGIVMAMVGAIVPTLTGTMSLTLGMVGTLFLFMNFAMLMASLLVGLVMDRHGLKLPLTVGAWLVALALALIGGATSYTILLPAVACLGFGGGALNAAANTLVADLHDDPARKAAALNLLGVFFGFGALVLPFSIGALTARLGMPALLFGASSLCAFVGLLAAGAAFPPPKQRHGWPLANMSRFVGIPVVRATAVLLFFQSGNEFLLGGYIATFFTRELTLPVASASYVLAGYWASIMIARVVLSRVLLRGGAAAVVLAGAIAAAGGALLIALAPTMGVALIGTVLTGLALGGIFPSVLGLTGARFQGHSGTVFGILFTVALCGGMTVPWLAGHLAEGAGLRAVFVLAAANFAAIAALSVVATRRRAL